MKHFQNLMTQGVKKKKKKQIIRSKFLNNSKEIQQPLNQSISHRLNQTRLSFHTLFLLANLHTI